MWHLYLGIADEKENVYNSGILGTVIIAFTANQPSFSFTPFIIVITH
jgi:hypothetical protein